MWWNLGLMGANALLKGNQAKNQREQQKQENIAASEQTRYSPWSGMGKGKMNNSYAPSEMEGMVSGGIQGLGIAQGLKGLGGAESTNAVTDGNIMGGEGMLSDGGQGMAQNSGYGLMPQNNQYAAMPKMWWNK